MNNLPSSLSKSKIVLHMIVEKDAQTMMYGASSFSIMIDKEGNPVIKTLKVTSSRRLKYGK